ncbi:MAG TPA: S8 family serine peptidase, partial [Steroidobacteraceae bacterium]
VGPDGGNDTFLGFTFASATPPIVDNTNIAGCGNKASYPNLFGTSAATPHVASAAALLLQADPSLTPAQIYANFRSSTLPMNGSGYNKASGFGFFQADLAANAIPPILPSTPTLTLANSSITVGGSTTLTWSSANNQGCTAGGGSAGWSGPVASSGTQTLTPTAVGMDTYTLFCTNIVSGASPTASVKLTVSAAAASGGSHGGGALGLYSVFGLLGLLAARTRNALRVARVTA